MFGVVIIFSIPVILVLVDFFKFIFTNDRLFASEGNKGLAIVVMVGLPILFLNMFDFGLKNDCCSDSAVFSPDHRATIYTLIALCLVSFFYSIYRKKIAPPFPEIIVNSLLVIGIILNIAIAFQVESPIFLLLGNLPIILLFMITLIENQQKIISRFQSSQTKEGLFHEILKLDFFFQLPFFVLFGMPIIFVFTILLMLFGQKPDALIQAFTQTYKHGLSQLDYMCDNVHCGGHFLCSVAANGHKKLVQPKRLGMRASNPIICNRQLLVANAFEELIEQKLPSLHILIRKNYNKVGNLIHKHYHVFNIKWVSNIIYILMKPLEWVFLFTLYCFDHNPENRIAQQYLKKTDRDYLKKALS